MEAFNGCDVLNITDHFDDENEIEVIYYPCDSCDKRFDNYEHLKTHLTSYHMPENPLKCSLEECRFSSKDIHYRHR